MARKSRRLRRYELFGQTVNAPEAIARVKGDVLPVPEACRFCVGKVNLVNNAEFYGGREYGWPLAYRCSCCGARVGTHLGTDIPLGTLANEVTIKARIAAHDAFDPLWKGKTPWHRSQAYQALARAMQKRFAHISWMDEQECRKVVELCRIGALQV